MGPNNPDFTLESKKRIAAVVRNAERAPANYKNVPRPANPQGGPGLPPAQYQGMVLQVVVDGTWGADYVPSVEALT